MEIPKLIEGGISVDDRGVVQYCNDFDFAGVKRFYTIQNHQVGFVRAWHGHKREAKYVTVLSGVAVVGVASMYYSVAKRDGSGVFEKKMLDSTLSLSSIREMNSVWWGEKASEKIILPETYRFVLSSLVPAVLYIPGGYMNGSMALSEDTIIVHFSTMTMEETQGDDVRFPASYFSEVWEVKQR